MTSRSDRVVAEQLLAIAKQLVVAWNPWGRTPPPLPRKSSTPPPLPQKSATPQEMELQKKTKQAEDTFLYKENSRQAILDEVEDLIDALIKDPSMVTKSKKKEYNTKIDEKMNLDLVPGPESSQRMPLKPKEKKFAQDSLKQELDMAMDQKSLSNPKVKEVVLKNLKSRLAQAKLRLLIAQLEKLDSL